MRKQLTVFLLALGALSLLMASVQAQANPAIVTKDGVFVGVILVDEDTGMVSAHFSDLDDVLCWAGCSDCSGGLGDEEIRLHSVETFSSNLNNSITGAVYSFVAANMDMARICLNLGWGQMDFSWTMKNHGENRNRMTIGGTMDTLPFICPSMKLDFNVVLNHKGLKGPNIECVEPD